MHEQRVTGSYKDPSGYVFQKDDQLYRRINECYLDTYKQVRDSGLFQELMQKRLLIEHEEILVEGGDDPHAIIRPKMIKFISYPYEWCFSQLKDAALATLEIQRMAISRGFTLKDAHGFNIQFDRGLAILIDSLSFDRWDHAPWEAYRQFCESFLVPLALMGYRSQYSNTLLTRFLNGIPLEIGSGLLPLRTRFSISLLMHIHLHARKAKEDSKMVDTSPAFNSSRRFSDHSMLGLCMSLEKAIRSIRHPEVRLCQKSLSYFQDSFDREKRFIVSVTQEQRPSIVWDLGCDTGEFSILAANHSDFVVAIDSDPACIERLYLYCKTEQITNILPLQMDLVNPSAALGWELQERLSLFERGSCDLVFALAIVHHLCISANIPMDYIARFFGRISNRLVIEFVPKKDPQVQLLLSARKDIFPNYNLATFELAFERYFSIIRSEELANSNRTIYYMVRRSGEKYNA
jgi:ribosomal protein L11 methylase PrmA